MTCIYMMHVEIFQDLKISRGQCVYMIEIFQAFKLSRQCITRLEIFQNFKISNYYLKNHTMLVM